MALALESRARAAARGRLGQEALSLCRSIALSRALCLSLCVWRRVALRGWTVQEALVSVSACLDRVWRRGGPTSTSHSATNGGAVLATRLEDTVSEYVHCGWTPWRLLHVRIH